MTDDARPISEIVEELEGGDPDELVYLDAVISEAAEARWGPGGMEVYDRHKRLTDALGIPFNDYDRFMMHCHGRALTVARPFELGRSAR